MTKEEGEACRGRGGREAFQEKEEEEDDSLMSMTTYLIPTSTTTQSCNQTINCCQIRSESLCVVICASLAEVP